MGAQTARAARAGGLWGRLRRRGQDQALALTFGGALAAGRFQVWYQPKFDLAAGGLRGAEALVRWQRAGRLAPPDRFIPVLERTGQIAELDAEVLRQVCRDIGEARRRGLALGNISVNLSRRHLAGPDAVQRIEALTAGAGVGGDELSFEITESAAESDAGQLARQVGRLRAMGFGVQMDDFGMGSSTLGSLALTTFDALKLDRSLVARAGEGRMDVILACTIQMARRLGMEVVAEGVETARQAEFLRGAGCQLAQGYYFSRPLRREEFFALAQREAKS